MKFQSVSLTIGLSALSISTPLFSTPRVVAQEVAASCPLPKEIAVTFLNSKCKAVTLKKPQTFYRYYSDTTNKYGRYLTRNLYKTNLEVIRNLALNQSWGNKATTILRVTLPAGTVVYQGIVGPQTPSKCYPGGGQQTFIKDTRDLSIKWVEGENLVVKDFTCQ